MYRYQHDRTSDQFQTLINRIADGHITVPLNPFVFTYGAMPTEAAIRAGYYPGSIERAYGIHFPLAQAIENSTIPWGVASIWAGSGVKYTWKGICDCASDELAHNRTDGEVFKWQGPDNKTVYMKWYYPDDQTGNWPSWGGYTEARRIVTGGTPDSAEIQRALTYFSGRAPSIPIIGLFGMGGDDFAWPTNNQLITPEDAAHSWNTAHPGGDQVIVSNEIDYFQDLESNYASSLGTIRGGWGTDWELWSQTLSERTAKTKRAFEQLHGAEALAALVHRFDGGTLWSTSQSSLATALIGYWKYIEHAWSNPPDMTTYLATKGTQATTWANAVSTVESNSGSALAGYFNTPNEDRFVVFNPLAFQRTDYADVPIGGAGPYVVTDVTTNTEVPNQVVTISGSRYLRILATDVPSMGYRVYRYVSGTPTAMNNAASVAGGTLTGDDGHYAVTIGTGGRLTSVVDVLNGNQQLVGSALNLSDTNAAGTCTFSTVNAGPVSVSLACALTGSPPRTVTVTLVRNVDRIAVTDEVTANWSAPLHYKYNVNLISPQIHFEEVGAIARPGLIAEGGDFLPGARPQYMTLNHFVNFATSQYGITLSNWDASFMRVGNSTYSAFDLSRPEVNILGVGNPHLYGPDASCPTVGGPCDTQQQAGDTYFLTQLALQGSASAYSGAQAMRMALAHQNPLRTLALARNQAGPLSDPTASFLSVSAPNVVVTAFKPAEEGERGIVVRLWELAGQYTDFTIDASAFIPTAAFQVSLVETDVAAASMNNGLISASIAANEIKAYRFAGASGSPTVIATATCSSTPTATPASTSTPTPTATPVSTSSPTGTATLPQTSTPTFMVTVAPTATVTTSATQTPEVTVTATPLIAGDVNGDGRVDTGDFDALISALFDLHPPARADVNGDGRVTSADVPALVSILGGDVGTTSRH